MDSFLASGRDKDVELALRHGRPRSIAIYVLTGGLMSYHASFDGYRVMGSYAGRIFEGGEAADLPVYEAAKVELMINLNPAKALGIAVPPSSAHPDRRGGGVRRRDFLALVGQAARPLGVGAEQAEQAINVRAANAIGITIPPALLVDADEVVE
jgi:hypothetical protein